MKLLMIDHYDSFTYNLYALLKRAGCELDMIKYDDVANVTNYAGLVLSPGPSSPINAGNSLQYVNDCAGKIPIFGVCLGMQIIGHILGYEVSSASSIMHGKTDLVETSKDSALFKGLPDRFTVVRYHSLAVKGCSEITTSKAVSDSEVMSIELPAKLLYGVQFHPESIKSEYGMEIVSNFLSICKNNG